MKTKFESTNSGATTQKLTSLRIRIGKLAPTDLLEFLGKSDGAVPEDNEFLIPQQKNASGVTKFFSVDEIVSTKMKMHDRLVSACWPVADAEGGNLVCVVVGKKSGVYFWDHEQEEAVPSWKNMYRLACSLGEFLELLEPFDIGSVELKPEQVKSVWVSPELQHLVKKT